MEEIVRKNTQQLLACIEKGIFCSKSQQKSTTISKLGVTLFPSAKAQCGLSLYLSVHGILHPERIYIEIFPGIRQKSHISSSQIFVQKHEHCKMKTTSHWGIFCYTHLNRLLYICKKRGVYRKTTDFSKKDSVAIYKIKNISAQIPKNVSYNQVFASERSSPCLPVFRRPHMQGWKFALSLFVLLLLSLYT